MKQLIEKMKSFLDGNETVIIEEFEKKIGYSLETVCSILEKYGMPHWFSVEVPRTRSEITVGMLAELCEDNQFLILFDDFYIKDCLYSDDAKKMRKGMYHDYPISKLKLVNDDGACFFEIYITQD